MIRHIVLFKLKEFDSPKAKKDCMQAIKEALEALMKKIEVLRAIHVDFNCNPSETWDLILTTEFDSMADLETYASHPEHVAVGKNLIAPVKADRACVDYEVL